MFNGYSSTASRAHVAWSLPPCTCKLQRLKTLDGNGAADTKLWLTSYNIQRLLLTATLLENKMYDEPFDSYKQWAAIGDLTNQEMNALELEILFALKFSLVVSREEYDQCHEVLLLIVHVTLQTHHCPDMKWVWHDNLARESPSCLNECMSSH